ncbi:Rpn family recombination-promoting nuclease/putative transposase [Bariatricus sp. SGI.154]|uniref:Rpn family recombination-promoting nuclease/putative transposase n=1 Tax=Bariatricus sp. SGI.154 TaxID=3420549 RepID=UPI003D00EBE3
MSKPQNRIPLKVLNLTNRFLFDEVKEDPQIHQDALSIIFGKEIPLLSHNETEKEVRVSPLARSIRMDVFSMDEDDTVYNTEMQDTKKYDLAKRSRYYQGLIDTGFLEPGIPDYNLLKTVYIIMIMTFDLFGYGKYQYTFEARCNEVPECLLEDKVTRIFLNTKGKNDNEVSEELIEFLHYLENTTDEVAEKSGSERIRRIHDRVCKVKTSEEVGIRYMQAWEEKYYEREEGREEGREELLKEQIAKKLEKGKTLEAIADEVEKDVEEIRGLVEELKNQRNAI